VKSLPGSFVRFFFKSEALRGAFIKELLKSTSILNSVHNAARPKQNGQSFLDFHFLELY